MSRPSKEYLWNTNIYNQRIIFLISGIAWKGTCLVFQLRYFDTDKLSHKGECRRRMSNNTDFIIYKVRCSPPPKENFLWSRTRVTEQPYLDAAPTILCVFVGRLSSYNLSPTLARSIPRVGPIILVHWKTNIPGRFPLINDSSPLGSLIAIYLHSRPLAPPQNILYPSCVPQMVATWTPDLLIWRTWCWSEGFAQFSPSL